MKIVDAISTELFVGRDDAPLQVVTVSLLNTGDAVWTREDPATVEVYSDAFVSVASAEVTDVGPSERVTVEIGVPVDPDLPPGTTMAADVAGSARDRRDRRAFSFTVAEPGWRMFMVAHFHYDPVWWNTQAFYTETWEKLPRSERPWEGRRQQPAFTLIEAHVDLARRDPDYKFVLAELDYLKPYWDAFPEERAYLRQLLAEGRLELMGGTYNEANTNLTSAESTIRNAVYGVGYQRDVLGGAPATAWQLDVFGHDPQFPGMMADAGLTSSSWARGPFHQWGPRLGVGDNRRMQFDSEFDWVAPSGRGLLTSYMPNHYSAGWDIDKASTLVEAESEALRLFTELKPVAATRNVLLPVGTDYTPPGRWITDIHRGWNARYVWPKFLVALPREFFDAVRAELAGRGAAPQTRDMNPVYTGKDVSFIDTKQAQRVGENTLLAAEKFSTVAALLGARYPTEAFDKAWRQLLFGAHHDGITGTESDQVYLDLVGGWRDTWELGREALHDALDYIAGRVDTRQQGRETAGEADVGASALTVFNPLSWERTDVVRTDVTLDPPAPGLRLLDDNGREVPFVVEAFNRDDHDLLRSCTLSFIATDVPSVGYRTYQLVPAGRLPDDAAWEPVETRRIANDFYELEVDPDRGGAICDLVDRRDKRSVLKPGGLANELLAYDEYPTHPDHGEGPWHLLPVGTVRSSAGEVDGAENTATVVTERSAVGERIVSTTRFDGCDVAQQVALYAGVSRVDCVTSIDGFTGQDTLFRMRVAADVPGGMPVSEVGNAVIGRGFGFPAVDVADVPYTLDNPAYNWFALSSTVRVSLHEPSAPGENGDAFPSEHASRALSVAEVIVPDGAETSEGVRDLVVALVRKGVTSTVSRATGSRYGDIAADSNLPDTRIAVGGPDDNPFVADVLANAHPAYRARLDEQLTTDGVARVWIPAQRPLREVWQPNADLRGPRALPVLVIAGADGARTAAALDAVRADLADAVIGVAQPAGMAEAADGGGPPLGSLQRVDDYTVGVCNRGMPSFNVDAHGDLYLSFLRSCSGWPSGVWLDPPVRTVPDGSSFQFQHWTHHFEYSLVAGAGDWREAGLVRAGHAYNNPLHAVQVDAHPGPLPATAGFVRVDSGDVVVTTMKPVGNPMARMSAASADPSEGVALRIYEANGTHADARVELLWPVREAFATDLLESARQRIEVADGAVRHRIAPYEITTLGAVVDEPPAPGQAVELGRRGEPAQPVFSDYWLHNKGAAPVGYQPVTVQIPPRAIAADDAFEVPIIVASERTDDAVAGMLEVTVPPGWSADTPSHPYRLAPGAHMAVTATVTPAPDAGAGRYFVGARIRDDAGQIHEDVITVDLRQAEHTVDTADGVTRALALDRATRKAVIMERPYDPSTTTMLGGELRVEVHGATGNGLIDVELHNLVDDEIRGEAQIISPWGTWEQVRPWTQGFAVAPRASRTVAFTANAPAGARPVSAWALVKVMYFGRVYYTPSFPLTLGARDPRDRPARAASRSGP